jgi:pimeloyl-ACP methyl ester carboxylesterase
VARMIGIGGRNLAVECSGAAEGKPVFLMHGTPGGRGGPRPRDIVLYRLNIWLISYDRPGYGRSDRHRNRIVADAASDVAHIADALGVGRFSIVGRSGGGPHALACAAMLRDRVERAAAMVSPAPPEAEGLDWFEGMTRSNVETYELADADKLLAEAELGRRAADVRADPEQMMASLLPGLAGLDGRVVNDISLRRLVTETIRDGLRESADGWIDDVLALRRPWGCELSDITASVLLWHGTEDRFSPVEHSRWLAGQIKDATLLIEKGAAHFGAFEVLPEVLAWLTAPHEAAATRQSAPADMPVWDSIRTAEGRPRAAAADSP